MNHEFYVIILWRHYIVLTSVSIEEIKLIAVINWFPVHQSSWDYLGCLSSMVNLINILHVQYNCFPKISYSNCSVFDCFNYLTFWFFFVFDFLGLLYFSLVFVCLTPNFAFNTTHYYFYNFRNILNLPVLPTVFLAHYFHFYNCDASNYSYLYILRETFKKFWKKNLIPENMCQKYFV